MFKNKNKKEKYHYIKVSQNKGFTLIELLVSIAIFSIVVLITIGSILTIVDANRKARSLMTVMNNLNFAIESMTRSFQTGNKPYDYVYGCTNSFETNEVNYVETESALEIIPRPVSYCLKDVDGVGKIVKKVDSTEFDLTSPDIDIDVSNSSLEVLNINSQPLLFMNIVGEVVESPTIRSEFRIQSTVNQRDLNL